jgi:hypothetical protein
MTSSSDTTLLDILDAHGQKFLDSFKPHKAAEKRNKGAAVDTTEAHRSSKRVKVEHDRSSSIDCSDSEEEWTGFGNDAQIGDEYEIHSSREEGMPLEGGPAGLQVDNARK